MTRRYPVPVCWILWLSRLMHVQPIEDSENGCVYKQVIGSRVYHVQSAWNLGIYSRVFLQSNRHSASHSSSSPNPTLYSSFVNNSLLGGEKRQGIKLHMMRVINLRCSFQMYLRLAGLFLSSDLFGWSKHNQNKYGHAL